MASGAHRNFQKPHRKNQKHYPNTLWCCSWPSRAPLQEELLDRFCSCAILLNAPGGAQPWAACKLPLRICCRMKEDNRGGMVYWSIHLVKGHLVVYGRWYFCVIFTAVPVQHLCSASLCQSCKVSLAAGCNTEARISCGSTVQRHAAAVAAQCRGTRQLWQHNAEARVSCGSTMQSKNRRLKCSQGSGGCTSKVRPQTAKGSFS